VVPPAPAPVEQSFPIPDVVGMNLQEAQDLIQRDAGVMVILSHDLYSDRVQVIDTAWQVCEQNIPAGTPLTDANEGTIDLGVVRVEEDCDGSGPAAAPAPSRIVPPPAPAPADSGTVSQRNAVDKAEQYLDTIGGFSREGLIRQLTVGSGFSTEDATYAVENIEIDWNEQAAEKARQYQDTIGGFSRDGMIRQLTVGSGFTAEQAAYGADSVGL
jgi:hypothetical protein